MIRIQTLSGKDKTITIILIVILAAIFYQPLISLIADILSKVLFLAWQMAGVIDKLIWGIK